LAACALAFDKELKRVDLPTFGNPTIPHCNGIENGKFRAKVGEISQQSTVNSKGGLIRPSLSALFFCSSFSCSFFCIFVKKKGMKYILEIDDTTTLGQSLIGLVKALLKKDKGLNLFSESEIEKREDALLGKMVKESMKSGLADNQKVFSTLGLK